MMAIASLLALVVDGVLLQNIAFVLFVVFWIQGLPIVHWMHAQQILPLGAVVAGTVGIALAEAHLAAEFNPASGEPVVDRLVTVHSEAIGLFELRRNAEKHIEVRNARQKG